MMLSNQTTTIERILELDSAAQDIFRTSWPESWLQLNLPLGSTRALLAIEGRNARTPGKVAETLGVSRTTVSGMLDRLEAEGMLTRAIDPSDRRSFTLQLTERGKKLVAQIEGSRRERMRDALEHMSEADKAALQSGLAALVEALRAGSTVDETASK